MAVRRRRPRGTLIHSESRKANCRDNAVAESFFSSLKKVRIKKQICKNREVAISGQAAAE
jgi:transposase InsO family protein